MAETIEVRRSYLQYWREMNAAGVVGLERFARLVQRVVDTRVQEAAAGEAGDDGKETPRRILDDLVDVFVSPRFRIEKTLVMASPAVLGEEVILERNDDLEGFSERFTAGEGRFRHFALNAAASLTAPAALVELAARVRGGDLVSSSEDSSADLATNQVGRAFTKLLLDRPLAELADGRTVRDWIVEQFGGER